LIVNQYGRIRGARRAEGKETKALMEPEVPRRETVFGDIKGKVVTTQLLLILVYASCVPTRRLSDNMRLIRSRTKFLVWII
jgi:hypothetical protein